MFSMHCCCSVTKSCLILCDPMDCNMPGLPVHHHHLPEFKYMFIKLVTQFNHLIFWHCLLLPPSVFPSIRVLSNESALCIRWPKYWSFIRPSNEYSGLISFWIDYFDLLAVQRTLKSLLQYHNSKPAILRPSAFFMVQISMYT